jgi:hypothetical protein
MARTSCILSDDDNDPPPFVLDQHVEMHLSSATSLKLQIAGRHITLLGHIITIPSQPVFVLNH